MCSIFWLVGREADPKFYKLSNSFELTRRSLLGENIDRRIVRTLNVKTVTNVTTATFVKNKNAKCKNSTSYVKKMSQMWKNTVTNVKYFRS